MKRVALLLACVLGFQADDAGACSMDPPKEVPDRREVARAADLVAVIRIEGIEPLTPAEEAELQRLLTNPPLGVPFKYPAPGLRFSVSRVLKGDVPAGALIQNGATNCEVFLAPDQDYVLFARLPAAPGGRIVPLDGTFYLGKTERDKANLAEVESSLNHSNPTRP